MTTSSKKIKEANATFTLKTGFKQPKDERAALLMLGTSPAEYVTKLLGRANESLGVSNDLVHEALFASLLHFYGTGDCTLLTKAVNFSVIKKHKSAIKLWVQTYSPAVFRATKSGDQFKKDKKDNANEFDLMKAFENPFYNIKVMTKEDAQELYSFNSLQSAIKRVIKRANKKLDDESVEARDINGVKDVVETLESLLTMRPVEMQPVSNVNHEVKIEKKAIAS